MNYQNVDSDQQGHDPSTHQDTTGAEEGQSASRSHQQELVNFIEEAGTANTNPPPAFGDDQDDAEEQPYAIHKPLPPGVIEKLSELNSSSESIVSEHQEEAEITVSDEIPGDEQVSSHFIENDEFGARELSVIHEGSERSSTHSNNESSLESGATTSFERPSQEGLRIDRRSEQSRSFVSPTESTQGDIPQQRPTSVIAADSSDLQTSSESPDAATMQPQAPGSSARRPLIPPAAREHVDERSSTRNQLKVLFKALSHPRSALRTIRDFSRGR